MSSSHSITSSHVPSSFHMHQYRNQLLHDGYTIIRHYFSNECMAIINGLFDDYASKNESPVMVIQSIHFWHVIAALDPIVQRLLGRDYVVLPDMWAWDIPPGKSNYGWAPHREKRFNTLNNDDTPVSLSIWISVTHATPENSCLYVIPASDDPGYPHDTSVSMHAMQSIRALPTNPGDVIAFNHHVLHWGSQSSQWALGPRRSMAYECQQSHIPPFNTPTFLAHAPPSQATRASLYDQVMSQYHHMHR